ncbi:MAG: hypothetical protein ACI9LM_002135 [Alteromonadaceae bacterium]|jgi:hypothetical protein
MHGIGIVKARLIDNLKGSRHQKILVDMNHNKSILIIHNIDISNKVINLKLGNINRTPVMGCSIEHKKTRTVFIRAVGLRQ